MRAPITTVVSDTYVKLGSTQDYSSQTENWICNNSYGERYTLLKVTDLPPIASDQFITKAYIYLWPSASPAADTVFYAREIDTDWLPSAVTFASIQSHIGTENLDYAICKADK